MRKFSEYKRGSDFKKQILAMVSARFLNIALVGVFLSLFLVGSCKTSELSGVNNTETVGILPDAEQSQKYTPARGYAYTARKYISDNPDALLHMTEMQVKYLLGNPNIKWNENPAEIWEYKTQACVLDVYFYRDKVLERGMSSVESSLGHHRKVSYYELRQTDKPDWSRSKENTQYVPSKVQTARKINHCMDQIISRRS